MKRRSFLAMLGIAPVAAAVPAVAATKEIAPFEPSKTAITVDVSNIGAIQVGDIQRMIAEQQEWVREALHRQQRIVVYDPRLR